MGTDVCLTMVDGKVLYRDGLYTTLDPERVAYQAEQSVQKILSQL
jgi:5-methylthioadenosine/S-adenosylhomocysteine deaminase